MINDKQIKEEIEESFSNSDEFKKLSEVQKKDIYNIARFLVSTDEFLFALELLNAAIIRQVPDIRFFGDDGFEFLLADEKLIAVTDYFDAQHKYFKDKLNYEKN